MNYEVKLMQHPLNFVDILSLWRVSAVSAVTRMSTRWRHCSNSTWGSFLNLWCPGLNTRTFWTAPTCWTQTAKRFVGFYKKETIQPNGVKRCECKAEVFLFFPDVYLAFKMWFLCFLKGWARLEQQIVLLPRLNYNLLGYVCQWVETTNVWGKSYWTKRPQWSSYGTEKQAAKNRKFDKK